MVVKVAAEPPILPILLKSQIFGGLTGLKSSPQLARHRDEESVYKLQKVKITNNK